MERQLEAAHAVLTKVVWTSPQQLRKLADALERVGKSVSSGESVLIPLTKTITIAAEPSTWDNESAHTEQSLG